MGESSKDIKKRYSFDEREKMWWNVSPKLFGDNLVDINDFSPEHYVYFLDNVKSLDELVTGLLELSPLADDALLVAENLSDQEFLEFKEVLIKDRCEEDTDMPEKFRTLILPERFMPAVLLADEFCVPLGVALVRMLMIEEKSSLLEK